MLAVAKKIARALLGDYSVYRVYRLDPGNATAAAAAAAADAPSAIAASLPPQPTPFTVCPIDRSTLEACADPLLREQAFYCGEQSHAYGCSRDGQLLGVCFFWHGDRYRTRNFWPLAEGEAKLVQIVASEQARGQGVAGRLLREAAQDMAAHGFGPLYARIWHSNQPSIAAFERAGWRRIATVALVHPLQRERPLRFTW